jgi:uncharacterized alpha-E superfamily protein
LPSRTAANLLWLGRYVERAEATLRLVRALVNRASDSDEVATQVVEQICELLGAWEAVPTDLPSPLPNPPPHSASTRAFTPVHSASQTRVNALEDGLSTRVTALTRGTVGRGLLVASGALQRRDLPGALPFLVSSAQSAASVIRDRFSPDAWRALTDLHELIAAPLDQAPTESAIFERTNAALRIVASFSGLAQENMSQLAGWRFLELGRRIERAIAISRFVRQFAFAPELAGGLDVLLELADSQITYRRRYVMVAAPAPVIDLVVLDPNNPRSVAYQVDRIETHLAVLSKRSAENRLSPPEQIATALAAQFRTTDAADLDEATFMRAEETLMKLADMIASTYFTTHARADVRWEALG